MMVMHGGHPPAQGDAVLLLFLLVFVRLVCPVLLAGMLMAQGTLLPRVLAAGVQHLQGAAFFFLVCSLQHRLMWSLLGSLLVEVSRSPAVSQTADSWSCVSSSSARPRRRQLLSCGQRLASPPHQLQSLCSLSCAC